MSCLSSSLGIVRADSGRDVQTPTSSASAAVDQGYAIERHVLANGVVCAARWVPDPDIVAISIGVRAGSRFEDEASAGAAKFMEKLFLQGTDRRPSPDEVQRPLTVRGGMLSTLAGSELVIVQAQVRTADVEVMLDVLADVLLCSQFRQDRVANEARVILEELSSRKANPNVLASDIFFPAVLAGHPLERSPAGDEENVPRLTREALVAYRDRYFVGENTVIAVSGNLATAEAIQRIEDRFGSMPSGVAAPPSDVPPPPARSQRIEHKAGSAQTRVIVGAPTPGLQSEDRFPLTIVNAVLGPSGFRLFREIRDLRGLSYDPSPALMLFPDAGVWMSSCGTDPANRDTVVDLLEVELNRLRRQPLSADELSNAKKFVKGSLVVGLETPMAQSGQMIRDEAFGSPVLAPEHIEGIRKVTADDVLRVACDYMDPERSTLVVVEP